MLLCIYSLSRFLVPFLFSSTPVSIFLLLISLLPPTIFVLSGPIELLAGLRFMLSHDQLEKTVKKLTLLKIWKTYLRQEHILLADRDIRVVILPGKCFRHCTTLSLLGFFFLSRCNLLTHIQILIRSGYAF